MNDPRELFSKSFPGDSSDEDREEVDILEQLGKLEYEKARLLAQLKDRGKEKDVLNLRAAEGPTAQKSKGSVQASIPQDVLGDPPKHSTSYFIENLEKLQQRDKIEKQHQQEFMKRRIHTFRATDLEYRPENVDELDLYSKKRLSVRYLPKEVLNEILADKKILRLPKLYAKVRPPNFQEPDYANWVCCGILSQKSEVKVTSGLNRSSKYFSVTLTDFTFQIKVLIFGDKNVKKYYNLSIGDVIGVLNPSVWPWSDDRENGVARSFNLSVKSEGLNTIIEIGKAKDFGLCPIRNYKTKEPCNTPINLAVEDRCEFHREKQISKGNSKRIELNGVNTALRGPRNKELIRLSNGQYVTSKKEVKLPDKFATLKSKHKFSSVNAAKAFYDDDYVNPDTFKNLGNKRRRVEDYNNEKKLRAKLGVPIASKTNLGSKSNVQQIGNGARQTNEQAQTKPNRASEKSDKQKAIDEFNAMLKNRKHVSLRASKEDIEAIKTSRAKIHEKYSKRKVLTSVDELGFGMDDDDEDDLFIVR
ncbi:hypothetical protein ACO0QE_000079 [Hanseniaspora vineae]